MVIEKADKRITNDDRPRLILPVSHNKVLELAQNEIMKDPIWEGTPCRGREAPGSH